MDEVFFEKVKNQLMKNNTCAFSMKGKFQIEMQLQKMEPNDVEFWKENEIKRQFNPSFSYCAKTNNILVVQKQLILMYSIV